MSMKMKGLGKGLSALFADTEAEYVQNTLLGEDKGEKKPDEAAAPATRIVQVEKPVFVSDGKPSELPISKVVPNPDQPRKHFDQTALEELAESIRIHGIIQPLVVVKKGDQYIIIAGERRWRASQIAGLKTVPAVIKQFSEQQIKEVALIENLQRQDLNFFEEAEAVQRLVDKYSMSREEAADKLGRAQSTLSNKLRLLRLPEEMRYTIEKAGLTERHARALLTLENDVQRERALEIITDRHLNVQESERLIEQMLNRRKKKNPIKGIRDIRVFINTLNHAVEAIRRAGIDADAAKSETEEYVEYTVRIPKIEQIRISLPGDGEAV